MSQSDFATCTYTIRVSGSYVLTEDIHFIHGSQDGIRIVTNDVSIDLNGFGFHGPGLGSGSGILAFDLRNISVGNGILADWRGAGEAALYLVAYNSRVDRVTAHNNSGGLFAGGGVVVSECVAFSNTMTGIAASQGAVRDCAAMQNAQGGLWVSGPATVTRCTATSNQYVGIVGSSEVVISDCAAYGNASNGIFGSVGTTIIDCTVMNNGHEGIVVESLSMVKGSRALGNGTSGIAVGSSCLVVDCTAVSNGIAGILVESGGMVADCVAFRNTGDGIELKSGRTRVVGNNASSNALAGIWSRDTAGGNHIQNNNLVRNQWGVEVDAGTNVVIKNSAANSKTANYLLIGVNSIGPLTSDESNTYECANFNL